MPAEALLGFVSYLLDRLHWRSLVKTCTYAFAMRACADTLEIMHCHVLHHAMKLLPLGGEIALSVFLAPNTQISRLLVVLLELTRVVFVQR